MEDADIQAVAEATTEEIEVGNRLSAAMGLRRISTLALSERTGIPRQTIWRYQTGRSTQSLAVMAKLAKALRVRLEYLAYGSGRIEV